MKYLPYIAGVLAVAATGYYFWAYRPNEQKAAGKFPIAYGNDVPSEPVRRLQRAMNRHNAGGGTTPLIVDGLWGPLTADAIQAAGFPGYTYGPLTEDDLKYLEDESIG